MKSKVIGIIGGGQLGMMIAEACHSLGAKAICLDPNPKCSASYVCDDIVVSAYDDIEGLKRLGDMSDVLTYEFENIPANVLEYLKDSYNIKQGIKQLFDSQDRLREKDNAKKCGLNPPKYYPVSDMDSLKAGINELGYPCVYKTRTMGYDGHGQVVIKSEADILKVEPLLNVPGILEEFVNYDYEASIIMVRSAKKTVYFPISRNIHKGGILDLSVADKFDKEIEERMAKESIRFMANASYEGILAIEYFVKGKEIYFNEMAPRPHNSGHYTIEGCNTSQYLELVRYLLDMELVEPKLKAPTIMKNILGNDFDNVNKVINEDNVFVHMYHKDKCLPKRKMGHITFYNLTLDEYNLKYKNKFCED